MFTKTVGAILAALFLLLPTISLAHTLETHSTVGALFHIDPNDEPIAGQQAIIYIELQDKSHKLTSVNCQCNLKIFWNNKELYNNALFQTDSNSLSTQTSFTFPESGIYSVSIARQPEGGIEPFDLNYEVHVKPQIVTPTSTTESSEPTNHTAHYLIFGAGMVLLLVYLIYKLKNRKNKPSH